MVEKKLHILIVEDERELGYVLKLFLKSKGFEVTFANDGQEGLNSAKERAPDLIISDIVMPNMDGYELCRAVKAIDELSQIPFFFMSGLCQERDIKMAEAIGADEYLTKPFEYTVLIEKINKTFNL